MKYLAHISEDGREQTIEEHLKGTAELCRLYASAFGCEEQGEAAALMHDIGKYSEAFQHRLSGGAKTDHSTAGAYELYKSKRVVEAFCVSGHHSGLPDGGTRGDVDGATFFARISKASKGCIPDYSAFPAIEIKHCIPDSRFIKSIEKTFFYTRMLYSCLVDSDFKDTERFMSGSTQSNNSASNIDELNNRLDRFIFPWFNPQGELNKKRCEILNNCIHEGEHSGKGLFTLTVPTGGGKTVASLAFALRHAKQNGIRRVIYVVPYTSIIEQNAEVFRNVLGNENVLEHHSGFLFDKEENLSESFNYLSRALEDWDVPVIVTTAVQFFESLFSNRSSKCRKLHNVANSVIIFDEAQMIPVSCLKPCVFAISELVANYNSSAVLCTATQPALNSIFKVYQPDVCIREICPKHLYEDDIFRRVTFQKKANTVSLESIADELRTVNQALCIVNSRKSAFRLYDTLRSDSVFHLSTLMYPEHRKSVLKEIRRRVACGEPCVTVSTSLIEAGVDVDFPVVFREECGLDSVLQAAGRCNREGKRDPSKSVVTVFRTDEKTPPVFAIPISAYRLTENSFDDISSKEAVSCYFTELLSLKGDEALDKCGVMKLIKEEFMPFKKVAERFKLIDSDTRTVYIPLGEGEELVKRLLNGEITKELYRRLGQYGVSVYENHFYELEKAGALYMLEDSSAVLSDLSLYSEFTGLSLKADSGQALFI